MKHWRVGSVGIVRWTLLEEVVCCIERIHKEYVLPEDAEKDQVACKNTLDRTPWRVLELSNRIRGQVENISRSHFRAPDQRGYQQVDSVEVQEDRAACMG